MGCYRAFDGHGFICGDLGDNCSDCGGIAEYLCDFPVTEGKTCDRPICQSCARLIAEDLDYCSYHFKLWREYLESGQLISELDKITPFRCVVRFKDMPRFNK